MLSLLPVPIVRGEGTSVKWVNLRKIAFVILAGEPLGLIYPGVEPPNFSLSLARHIATLLLPSLSLLLPIHNSPAPPQLQLGEPSFQTNPRDGHFSLPWRTCLTQVFRPSRANKLWLQAIWIFLENNVLQHGFFPLC